MIRNEQIKVRLSMPNRDGSMAEEYKKLFLRRNSLKSVFESDCGKATLKRMLVDSGFFDATEEDNSRNFTIHMLESMGILDEGNIDRIVAFMVDGTETIPEPAEVGLDKKKIGEDDAE